MKIRKISTKKIQPAVYNPRKDLKPDDKEGVLALQRSLTEKLLKEIAAAFQQAVEYQQDVQELLG